MAKSEALRFSLALGPATHDQGKPQQHPGFLPKVAPSVRLLSESTVLSTCWARQPLVVVLEGGSLYDKDL